MNDKKTMKRSEIEGDDVDDIIGIAARMMNDDEGKLTPEQMREVGEELDIPVEYIEKARAELEVQRKRERRAANDKKERSKMVKMAAMGVAAVFVLVVVVGALSTSSSLNKLEGIVKQTRAQVENVKAREVETKARLKGRASSPDIDAELSGAANRVRVETKRMNDAIAAYNTKASSLFGTLATLFTGLPGSIK